MTELKQHIQSSIHLLNDCITNKVELNNEIFTSLLLLSLTAQLKLINALEKIPANNVQPDVKDTVINILTPVLNQIQGVTSSQSEDINVLKNQFKVLANTIGQMAELTLQQIKE